MKPLRVLLGCEYSGAARREFRALGHDAWSCDLLPADDGDLHHHQCDLFDVIDNDWDLAIFFPPCTHLAVSGAKHFATKRADGRQQAALEFVGRIMDCKIPSWGLENPVSIISSHFRKPDQIVQPWMFGHKATKTTCLWLHNLPQLVPTNIVDKGARHVTKSGKSLPAWYNLPPSPDRWKIRSTTFPGIAAAMASQYSEFLMKEHDELQQPRTQKRPT